MKTIKAKHIVQLLLFMIAAFGIAGTTGCDNKPAANNTNTATAQAPPSAAQPGSQSTPPKSKSGATGTIVVSPNPIKVCDGSGLGVANISWTLAGATLADVRIGTPDGMLFVQAGGAGTKATGKWVGNGSTFYLQDVSNGLPAIADNTIAKATASITTVGCP